MEKKISQMSKEELLNFSEQRIFSLGLRDLASALSYENMRYGLGKMIYALDSGDVYCVFGPDATITRNIGRWMSGFGYGAVIKWPDNGIYFPEIRPNGCGMIIARMDEMPPKREIIERVSEVENSELYLDGVKIEPDFGKGNHFFEFYKPLGISPDIEEIMPSDSSYAIIHGSGPEKKGEVYGAIDRGEWIKTPLGKISVLDGKDGKEYYKMYKELDKFSKKRREILAKEVLGDCKIISNLTHQGMFARNEIRLGCHDSMDRSYPRGKALFPVALRWDHPVYIFRGKENLSADVMGRLGFDKRAEDLGLKDELSKINILPHGGGYKIDLQYSNIEVIRTDIGNHFILSGAKPISKVEEISETAKRGVSSFGEMIIMNPHELPFDYRGTSIIEKIMEYDLGLPVAKLQPLMTLKV
ncbi:MAG TPA: hypothetical protein ENG12_03175 [Candidatus Altiarchaeales archaeon]|nr:hypothetical protein [Candidatus Altiarchaeales archaeon]